MEGPLEGADQPGQWDLAWLSGAAPHSGTTFELVGSVGFALVVNCISLVIADRLPAVTCPIASVGAMALTVYTGQVVAVWALGGSDYDDNGPWVAYVLVSIVFATVWRLFLGRGPLERLLTWSSNRAAGRAAHVLRRGDPDLTPPPAR